MRFFRGFDILCPYKSISSDCCHHRYAKKDPTTNLPTCTFIENNIHCPLYKLWIKQLEEQHKNDKKKKGNTISKKVSGM